MAKEERKRHSGEMGGEWRMVEDGLPEPEDFEPWERVLVVVRDTLSGPQNDDIYLAYMDYGASAPGWRDDHGRLFSSRELAVTHWMRIPGLSTVQERLFPKQCEWIDFSGICPHCLRELASDGVCCDRMGDLAENEQGG